MKEVNKHEFNTNYHLFRCIKETKNTHAVSLYLSEPIICEYVLVLESPWFCNFVDKADVNGMPTDLGLE